jgi:twitching motility protein PilT
MIDHINNNAAVNMVTIEDPIEYLYRDKMSIIAQREIGTDTYSFAKALRASFRQDPDVILIGEIRDADTMETAMSAADTGHLVMSTLHTMNAMETISRILSFFPPHQHQQIRLVLSGVLVAVVSLRLLPEKRWLRCCACCGNHDKYCGNCRVYSRSLKIASHHARDL